MSTRAFPTFCTAAVAIALASAPTPARASGFLVARFGGEYGHPTTDSPVAMYYNPAGLALRGGHLRLYVDGIFAFRAATYDRPTSAIDNVVEGSAMTAGTPNDMLGLATNSGKATLSNFLVSPFIGLTSDLGVKNLAVGAGFYVPFGGQASWSPNKTFDGNLKYPGAIDGQQRWHTMDGIIRSSYATLSVAYYIPKARLSLGVSGNLIISEVSTVRARNADGTDDVLTGSGTPKEGRSLIEVKGTTGSIAAGVIWKPTDASWIGVSYQSQPGFGENTLTGELTNKLGTADKVVQKVEFKQTLPDVVRFGARWRPTQRWELRLFGEYVRWRVFERQCLLDATDKDRKCLLAPDGAQDTAAGGKGILVNIDRRWNDGGGVRLGGSYFIRPDFEAFLGAGYDSNAVPDKTLEPSLMDMDKLTFSLGGKIGLVKDRLQLMGTLTQVAYFDRTVAPRARDATTGQPANIKPPTRTPDAAGTYTQSITLLQVGLEYTFF